MKWKKWIFYALAAAVCQFVMALPSMADGSDVSDIALTPGADQSQLNITWHSGNAAAGDACSVEVTKNPFMRKKAHGFFSLLPGFSSVYSGGWVEAADDENGDPQCYCKVTVDRLKKYEKYTYRVSDGSGEWSDAYGYAPGDKKEVGFLFVADSQIGASGPKDLSRSRDIKPYIGEYKTTLTYQELLDKGTLTEDDIEAIAEAWEDGALGDLADTYKDLDLTSLGTEIDRLYDLFYDEYGDEGSFTDLAALAEVDPVLAQNILDMIAERVAAQVAASEEDAAGWAATVGLMTEMYPEASFIVSGGDQVELNTAEWEYTGFFAPEELRSIPVAPTYASHDKALNYEYHFNLPNESEEYGQDSNGVGDYYFTYGDALVMVLNMDVTKGEFPRGEMGPPPGGGGPPGGDSSSTDSDGDGVDDDDDLCADTTDEEIANGVSLYGCPMTDEYDDDNDGVSNDLDLCGNTLKEHYEAGLISPDSGCPYFDDDADGIPNEDADGVTIDRCNNTYGDLSVDEDGCADCDYLETDDELRDWIAGLEYTCTTSEVTDDDGDTVYDDDGNAVTETTCEDTLADFKASLEEHQAFMEEAIAANPYIRWKIVVWHYSIYSAASHSADDDSEGIRYLFTPILEDLDIDVVLMGHDHAYTKTYQMIGNEPQHDQMTGKDGQVINPTGVLYLTGSSSSGSKYYGANCNLADETSSSAVYYDYAASWDEYIPTFTYFAVDQHTLKLSTYSYSFEVDDDGYYTGGIDEDSVFLLDEYAIEKKPAFRKKGKQGKGEGK